MQEKIAEMAAFLKEGQPVVFPTETVFALAADAQNPQAVEAIYRLKERQENKPLAILCDGLSMVEHCVEVSPKARRVCQQYMPGPFTAVLPIKQHTTLAQNLNKDRATLGVRVPDHKFALSVIRALGGPVAATSVNRSGENSAITAAQVKAFCQDQIPFFAADEADNHVKGRASTVVEFASSEPRLLREGDISFDEILRLYCA